MSFKSFPIAPVLIALCYLLLLGHHGLLEPDEGRYAEIAREMHDSGDLMVPTLNGFAHLTKPPLIYWSTAVCYQLFGVNEFSARLPSALAALGTLFLVFAIGRELGGRKAGWLAALVLASSIGFFALARLLTPDMSMCFWITAAVACAVKHSLAGQASRRYAWLFFVAMALGFLTKGPMAVVVPTCAAIGIALGGGKLRLPWLRGGMLFAVIALPWFVGLCIKHPELWGYFLEHELRDRIFGTSHGRAQPFWFFIPILAAAFLPWVFFAVPALIKSRREQMFERAEVGLLIGWIVPPLVVLSLSGSKLITYILPLLPALAVFMGVALARGYALPKRAPLALGSAFLIGCALLAAWPAFAPADLKISFTPLVLPVLAIAGLAAIAAPLTRIGQCRVATIATGTLVVLLVGVAQVGSLNPLLGRQATLKPLVESLRNEAGPGPVPVIASNVRAHGLEFYLGQTIDITRAQASLTLPPNSRGEERLHQSAASVAMISPTPEPVFVLTREPDWQKHFQPTGYWLPLDRAGDFVLLRSLPPNHPIADGRP